MPAIIHVHQLTKNYGSVRAVQGIDFEVRTGEIFAMLGPNGAGKSTTVEILEGLRPRDGGVVSVLSLLLVDGNPLEDIRGTRRISDVFFKGERVKRSTLFD